MAVIKYVPPAAYLFHRAVVVADVTVAIIFVGDAEKAYVAVGNNGAAEAKRAFGPFRQGVTQFVPVV